MFILYAADYAKEKWDIRGNLMMDLRMCLFRKFMNYTKEAQDEVPVSDMVTGLMADVADVTHGYMKVIEIARLSGKLGISVYFTLNHNPRVWWVLVLVPSLMALWGWLRTEYFIQ